MIIRERQAIKTRQFDIHLHQLWIATDKLFDGSPCRRAVETGVEDGRSICTGARRRAHAGSEQTGERFHVGLIHYLIPGLLWDLLIR